MGITVPLTRSLAQPLTKPHTQPQGVGSSDVTMQGMVAVRPVTQDTAGIGAFDTWFGATSDYIFTFNGHANWTDFAGSVDTLVTAYSGDTRPKIWAIGLNVTGTSLVDAAAGSFDSDYTTVATKVLADAPASGFIFIRPGHEFNISGLYPWEVIVSGHAAYYVEAFRRFVMAFRAVSSRFRFIWNPNWTSSSTPQFDVTTCYPGDGYVDVLGTDLYYDSEFDDTSPTVAFNYARDLTYGLAWQVAFARQHRRALALCEFGINWDRPQWIDLMYSWVTDNGYAYSGYWDATTSFTGRLSDGSLPDSGARFIADFRDGGPVPLFNHTFFWDVESFAKQGAQGTFSVVSAVAQITGVTDFASRAQRTWTGLTIGQNYRVTIDVDSNSLASRVRVAEAASPFTNLASISPNTASLTEQELTFTATQTSVNLQIVPFTNNAAQVVRFDNVKLFEA